MHALILDIAAKPALAYAAIFFVMLFEGEIAMLTAFFLVHEGLLSLAPTICAAVLGAFSGEVLWFAAGRKNGSGFIGRLIAKHRISLDRFDNYLRSKLFLTLFLSKFAYGAHHLVVFRAGMVGIDARRFARNDAIATTLWIIIVAGLGYASSVSFGLVQHRLRSVELAIVASIAIFIIAERIFARVFRKRL